MSNTLWILISLVMWALLVLVCDLVASSICSGKEDSEKNKLISWGVFTYSLVLITVTLAFSLMCIGIIDKQNKEKIEQLTEQIDSLKTLHEAGYDVKNL